MSNTQRFNPISQMSNSKSKTFRIVVLPGDGVGSEVTAAALRVLKHVAASSDAVYEFEEALIGGAALDACGDPLPAETLAACESADAVLLGAVGGPKWSDPNAAVRPEQGLLRLRRHFEFFANLRPIPVFPALIDRAPLRPELVRDVDILFVRELVGGLYFGDRREQSGGQDAYDTLTYSDAEIERIAEVAFRAARQRRCRVTSVDKANVLASMRQWRRTVERTSERFPDVRLEHRLVDACAMDLLRAPSRYDVILASNLFGDILSDEASVLAGSLGILPSASLGRSKFGLYEPVHGSAPDIAGRGIANPAGAILSAAMMLRHSFDLEHEALWIEKAVEQTFEDGIFTVDLCTQPTLPVSTDGMASAVIERLDAQAWESQVPMMVV